LRVIREESRNFNQNITEGGVSPGVVGDIGGSGAGKNQAKKRWNKVKNLLLTINKLQT
jgi:hypothetical protein